jgi:hypothetical protein
MFGFIATTTNRRRAAATRWSLVLSLPLLATVLGVAGCRLLAPDPAGVASADAAAVTSEGRWRASIGDGVLRSGSSRKEAWIAEIREQLQYATGALLGYGAALDLNTLDVAVDAADARRDGKERIVSYRALFAVDWPAASPPPGPERGGVRELVVPLPARGDKAGRSAFNELYRGCSGAGAEGGGPTFWHGYRPHAPHCRATEPGAPLVAPITIRLEPNAVAAGDPRLDRSDALWRDGALDVLVLVTGPGAAAELAALDAGLSASLGAKPGASADERRIAVDGRGTLTVHLLAADTLSMLSPVARRAAKSGVLQSGVVIVSTETALADAASTLTTWLDTAADGAASASDAKPGYYQLWVLRGRDRFPYALTAPYAADPDRPRDLVVRAASDAPKGAAQATLDTLVALTARQPSLPLLRAVAAAQSGQEPQARARLQLGAPAAASPGAKPQPTRAPP